MPREKKRSSKGARRQQPAAGGSRMPSEQQGRSKSANASIASTKKDRKKQHQRQSAMPADSYAYGTRTISRTSAQGLSITVQIPPLRRPRLSPDGMPAPKKRRRIFRPLVLVPLAILLAGGVLAGVNLRPHAAKHVATVSAAERTEPDFKPLVPAETASGKPNYDGSKNLVSFGTTFSDARVTVSEQPLPANFAADGGALKRAADSIDALQKIDTLHGPMYVTAPAKDKGQMAIYAESSVLVFAHADKELDSVSWKSFVEVLQSKNWQNINQ